MGTLVNPRRAADVRSALLASLVDHPGLPLAKAKERLGVGWGTIYHHVARLERSGAIRSIVQGRRRLLVLGGAPEAEAVARFALLEGMTARLLAEAILAQPGIGLRELARRSGVSERATYYHLKRLTEAGLVTTRKNGRYDSLEAAGDLVRSRMRCNEDQAPRGLDKAV